MRKTTGDLALMKQMNTAIVLDTLIREAPVSRAAISTLTGLNKATVSSLVLDLLDRELAVESGIGTSSGGRKPVMLLFNRHAGYAIGIDLGVNYIRGLLAALDGTVVAEELQQLEARELEAVLPLLEAVIDSLMAAAPASRYGIVGIVLGVPGLVDEEGTILFAPNLGWSQVRLAPLLQQRYNVPVTIDNEANAGAQGEQRYGAGQGRAHQIYISVGMGIGTGLILQHQLYKGAGGFSGELGHLSIHADGLPCSCGNRGCWELYASEKALLEQARELVTHTPKDTHKLDGSHTLDGTYTPDGSHMPDESHMLHGAHTLEELLEAAAQGNPRIQKLFAGIGEHLGIGIAGVLNAFNPEVVIIGNRLSRARRWIEEAMTQAVASRALLQHKQNARLLFAELGERSAVRGAAYEAISGFLAREKGM